jgi:hypothetical protein
MEHGSSRSRHWVMYLKNKQVKTHIVQVWIIRARHKRAISIGVGRGLTWPFGTHHVDDRVWNTWVCAYAKYSRPTWCTSGIGLVHQ